MVTLLLFLVVTSNPSPPDDPLTLCRRGNCVAALQLCGRTQPILIGNKLWEPGDLCLEVGQSYLEAGDVEKTALLWVRAAGKGPFWAMRSESVLKSFRNRFLRSSGGQGAQLLAYVQGKLCEFGVAEACTRLARLYLKGLGVLANRERALQFYKEACRMNPAHITLATADGNWTAMDQTGIVEACDFLVGYYRTRSPVEARSFSRRLTAVLGGR